MPEGEIWNGDRDILCERARVHKTKLLATQSAAVLRPAVCARPEGAVVGVPVMLWGWGGGKPWMD